jgi:hypothetical protein
MPYPGIPQLTDATTAWTQRDGALFATLSLDTVRHLAHGEANILWEPVLTCWKMGLRHRLECWVLLMCVIHEGNGSNPNKHSWRFLASCKRPVAHGHGTGLQRPEARSQRSREPPTATAPHHRWIA